MDQDTPQLSNSAHFLFFLRGGRSCFCFFFQAPQVIIMYSLGFEGLGSKSLPTQAVMGSEGQCLYSTELRPSTGSSGTVSYHLFARCLVHFAVPLNKCLWDEHWCESCQMSYISNHVTLFLAKPFCPLTQCFPSAQSWSLELEAVSQALPPTPFRTPWHSLLSDPTDPPPCPPSSDSTNPMWLRALRLPAGLLHTVHNI